MTEKEQDKTQEQQAADDFLRRERERLNLDSQEHGSNRLLLRNVLNAVFILLAIVAMVGVLIAPVGSSWLTAAYATGLLAVIVKMSEVMLRMPGMKKRETQSHKRYR